MQVSNALISVFDKTGLDVFVRGLSDLGVEIVASGGTAAYIGELGIDVVPVEELTDVPELLGGRVKTLHPRIHAGILARRGLEADLDELREHEIHAFDLVCVNLYPFQSVTSSRNVREEDAVEMIDIGGPALLRAAAKNFVDVVPVCEASRYEEILTELNAGGIELDTRQARGRGLPRTPPPTRPRSQRGSRTSRPSRPGCCSRSSARRSSHTARTRTSAPPSTRRGGGAQAPALRWSTCSAAGSCPSTTSTTSTPRAPFYGEFALPACVIVKHANPCGVAVAATIEEAYAKALAGDPVSAYGGVVALNRRASPERRPPSPASSSRSRSRQSTTRRGSPHSRSRRRCTSCATASGAVPSPGDRDFRQVLGGFLVQDTDAEVDDREGMTVVTSESHPDEEGWGDLLFAWRVAKHVGSNAIVVAKGLQTIGIGAGQMSRVDAVRLALEKAAEQGV